MIVYGDAQRARGSEELLSELETLAARAAEARPAQGREACTDLLIAAGVCAQGLLDEAFAARGCDDDDALARDCHALCLASAHALLWALDPARDSALSWASSVRDALLSLARLPLPTQVTVREPEGYAHYALYPEQYARAALMLRARAGRRAPSVIGVRSIGTSLGALVAAALDARFFCTVRPGGHPYRRTLAIGARLAHRLLEHGPGYAVVDEGPGRSGSSFAAVHGWLLAHGVAADDVCFFPSHDGPPGPHGDGSFRDRYARAARHHVSFAGAITGRAGERVVQLFAADLDAPLAEPAEELSGGRWRAKFYAQSSDYPLSNVCAEAPKFLLQTPSGGWLAKQIGLGARARQLTEQLHALSTHGLYPELRAARYGFILTRFYPEARPLDAHPVERPLLLHTLQRYLAFLAAEFPCRQGAGAPPSALYAMLSANARALLGPSAELDAALGPWAAELPALERSFAPIATDNKLDAPEWLALPDGRLLKCDALEHARAHDVIGRQDPAWDLAGAKVELGLARDEVAALVDALAAVTGHAPSEAKLRFYELGYLAFRAAQAELTREALAGNWPDDAERSARRGGAYRARLHAALGLAEDGA